MRLNDSVCTHFIYPPVHSSALLAPFPHMFQQSLSFLCANFHLDVFICRLCDDPAFSPVFFKVYSYTFRSPIIPSLWAISLPYIEEYLSLLFFLYALVFSLRVGRALFFFFFFFFSPKVLIRRDSQFNYFYSRACP